jgi:hypothetical protein
LSHCAAQYKRAFVALAYDEAAPGENTALHARFTKILDAMLEGLASDFAELGTLGEIVFKGSSGPPTTKIYKYLMRFERRNVLATFTLDTSGRVASLDLSG